MYKTSGSSLAYDNLRYFSKMTLSTTLYASHEQNTNTKGTPVPRELEREETAQGFAASGRECVPFKWGRYPSIDRGSGRVARQGFRPGGGVSAQAPRHPEVGPDRAKARQAGSGPAGVSPAEPSGVRPLREPAGGCTPPDPAGVRPDRRLAHL
ncbi:hypothetical protein Taro_007085 [Colocasia esculenta]|uniref:Uncharacterized protein n=1 Tax=Colocasia esculenta TaxID=4460 RepID=A0A843TYR2_COLES|nr:hypothetical protein [Colocasia esculenta]